MPTDILSLSYQVFKDFGCNVLLGGIIIFLLWKLATNHLHHIGMDLQVTNKKIDTLSEEVKSWKDGQDKKIDAVNEKVELLESKTSKIEGKIGM